MLAPLGWLTSSQVLFFMSELYSRSIAIFHSGKSCRVIAASRDAGSSAPLLSMLELSIRSTRTICLWDLAVRELTKFADLLWLVSDAVVLVLEIGPEPYAIWPRYKTRSVQLRDGSRSWAKDVRELGRATELSWITETRTIWRLGEPKGGKIQKSRIRKTKLGRRATELECKLLLDQKRVCYKAKGIPPPEVQNEIARSRNRYAMNMAEVWTQALSSSKKARLSSADWQEEAWKSHAGYTGSTRQRQSSRKRNHRQRIRHFSYDWLVNIFFLKWHKRFDKFGVEVKAGG